MQTNVLQAEVENLLTYLTKICYRLPGKGTRFGLDVGGMVIMFLRSAEIRDVIARAAIRKRIFSYDDCRIVPEHKPIHW